MKNAVLIIIAVALVILGFYFYGGDKHEDRKSDSMGNQEQSSENLFIAAGDVEIAPVEHATMALRWGDQILYFDPVGGAEVFAGLPQPDLIFVTDIHGDHFDSETLAAIRLAGVPLIVPQAVADELPENLQEDLVILSNGETTSQLGFSIEAIPMYNLPESEDSYHVKGRGNGYVIGRDSERVYVAGDTEGIPEMRNLKDIDVAFVPMNLPYTMSVEDAAEAVLAFAPRRVYPYHYRGTDGLSDVDKFKELVNAGNSEIEVGLLHWYPGQ